MCLSPFQAASLVFLSVLCDVPLGGIRISKIGSQAAASLRIDNVSICAQWHIFCYTLFGDASTLLFQCANPAALDVFLI